MSPAEPGEYRVFNQITEQFSLLDLAEMVTRQSKSFGLQAQVNHITNPRVEAEQHYYNATHTRLMDLGLEPHLLTDTVVESLIGLAIMHQKQIDYSLITPTVNWRNTANEVPVTEKLSPSSRSKYSEY
jgi:UDP-sulfoquinovose synthase